MMNNKAQSQETFAQPCAKNEHLAELAEEMPSVNCYVYCNNSPIDLVDPDGKKPDPPSKGWIRFWGGMKLVAGLLEASVGVTGGGVTSWTGGGAVLGGIVAVHGSDVAASGLSQLISGEDTSSLTSKAIQSTGVSKETADTVDGAISIVGSGASAGMVNNSKLSTTVRIETAPEEVKPNSSITKRPSSFRKSTIKNAWNEAENGAKPNTKSCPTCFKDVEGNPNLGGKRGGKWDVDHLPKWKDRELNGTRKDVLDNYNRGTRLRCVRCNRSDN